MLKLLRKAREKFFINCKNYIFYKDFYARKKQIEKLTRKQTIDFIIPIIVEYILKNDNYLITFKQANTIAKEYFTYFKYKDLFSELDNFTEKLW